MSVHIRNRTRSTPLHQYIYTNERFPMSIFHNTSDRDFFSLLNRKGRVFFFLVPSYDNLSVVDNKSNLSKIVYIMI